MVHEPIKMVPESAFAGIKDPTNMTMELGVALLPVKKVRPNSAEFRGKPLISILLTVVIFIAIIAVVDLIQSICVNIFLEPSIDDPVVIRERRAVFIGNTLFAAIIVIFAILATPLLLEKLRSSPSG